MKRITVEFSQKQAAQLRSYGVPVDPRDNSLKATPCTLKSIAQTCIDVEKANDDYWRSDTFWNNHDAIVAKIEQAHNSAFEVFPQRRRNPR